MIIDRTGFFSGTKARREKLRRMMTGHGGDIGTVRDIEIQGRDVTYTIYRHLDPDGFRYIDPVTGEAAVRTECHKK